MGAKYSENRTNAAVLLQALGDLGIEAALSEDAEGPRVAARERDLDAAACAADRDDFEAPLRDQAVLLAVVALRGDPGAGGEGESEVPAVEPNANVRGVPLQIDLEAVHDVPPAFGKILPFSSG